jgi:nitroreductase
VTSDQKNESDVSLLDGIASTRAIRRYLDEPVPDDVLAQIMFAASRAPSGSNRQAFRFIVLRDERPARQARVALGEAAREMWAHKRRNDGYDAGSGVDASSPKSRLAKTLSDYVDHFELAPVVILACMVRHREGTEETIGASVYPACQNLLLAARALGYGGVMTTWQRACEPRLREVLAIPDDVFIAATITMGRPVGAHGPVRRRPLNELVFAGKWGVEAPWATDAPGTEHTSAGPPA